MGALYCGPGWYDRMASGCGTAPPLARDEPKRQSAAAAPRPAPKGTSNEL